MYISSTTGVKVMCLNQNLFVDSVEHRGKVSIDILVDIFTLAIAMPKLISPLIFEE